MGSKKFRVHLKICRDTNAKLDRVASELTYYRTFLSNQEIIEIIGSSTSKMSIQNRYALAAYCLSKLDPQYALSILSYNMKSSFKALTHANIAIIYLRSGQITKCCETLSSINSKCLLWCFKKARITIYANIVERKKLADIHNVLTAKFDYTLFRILLQYLDVEDKDETLALIQTIERRLHECAYMSTINKKGLIFLYRVTRNKLIIDEMFRRYSTIDWLKDISNYMNIDLIDFKIEFLEKIYDPIIERVYRRLNVNNKSLVVRQKERFLKSYFCTYEFPTLYDNNST